MEKLTKEQTQYIKSILFFSGEATGGDKKPIFALADGSKDDDIYGHLLFPGAEHLALIDDEVFGYQVSAPPFLIELSEEEEDFWDSFTDYLITEQLNNQTCIFLQSQFDLDTLHKQLQSYVYPFGGMKKIFRFYDPVVLAEWLPSLNSEEVESLFSLVQAFWYKQPNEDTLVQVTKTADNQLVYLSRDYHNTLAKEWFDDLSNEQGNTGNV